MENKDSNHGTMQDHSQTDEVAAVLAAFYQYRGLLFSIAYRMLGSVADVEDMLQETFIRWQQAAREEIRSPRAFLVTVITRLCINELQSARVRREEYVGEWLPEPLVTDASSDPLAALSALEDARRVEVLVTRLHFGPGKSNGVALALMARLKRPGVRVVFLEKADDPELTAGLGEVAEGPVDAASLTDLVDKLLEMKGLSGMASEGIGGRTRRKVAFSGTDEGRDRRS